METSYGYPRISQRRGAFCSRLSLADNYQFKPAKVKNKINRVLVIDLLKLIKDSKKVNFNKNNSYLKTYPEFIKYFKDCKKINEHNYVVGIHAIYGWMPTILKKLDLTEINETLRILNNVKGGKKLEEKDLMHLKSKINNSLVGSSKLIHFINPKKYAIWDSRVYKYIFGKKPSSQTEKVSNYIKYISELERIEKDSRFDSVYKKVNSDIKKHFNYSVTKKRAIELIMFELSNI